MELPIFMLAGGFLVSILSGFLGIGGGIVLAPVLLYIPLVFGLGPLTMAQVSGLTITHGVVSSLVATRTHNKGHHINHRLVIWMGSTVAVMAFLGAYISRFLSHETLMILFSVMACGAAALMFFQTHNGDEVNDGRALAFNIPAAVAIAGAVGLLGGMVGQGGSFILIPLMLLFLKLPTRVVIGSNLAIAFIASCAGFVGKLATSQIPFPLVIFLVMGGILGAPIGSALSQRSSPIRLARALTIVVALAAVGICLDTLWH